MPPSNRDEQFGTYGERKPNIVRKTMVVGEQQEVGLGAQAVADALESAARAEPDSEAEPEAPPAPAVPEGGEPAADAEPAPTAAGDEPPATVADQPPEPAPAEPATPAPQPEAAAPEPPASEDAVTISRAEYEDLKRNGLMQADYTRKTQATAEVRKQAEATATAHREARDEYLRLIEEVTNLLKAGQQEPDWASARRTMAPEAYSDLRDAWAQRQSDLKAADAERKRVADKQAEDRAKRAQEFADAEREQLFTLRPELRDPAKLRSWLSRVKQTAQELGFTDKEFDGVGDHRLFLLLDRAASGKGVAVSKPVTTKPPVRSPRSAGPGAAAPPKAAPNAQEQARARVHKEHSVEAAGEYFATLIKD